MLGVYLSGTGNTRHCVEKLVGLLDKNAKLVPLEADGVIDAIKTEETIILGYPTQFSNIPFMVRSFIRNNDIWKGKKVICLTTMGAFSGDGTGCAARLLTKKGALVLGGLQIKMPDAVCDSKLLKKSPEENKRIVSDADRLIESAAEAIKNGKYPKKGLSIGAHLVGLFGQRLWFYRKTSNYSDKLNVHDNCIGCGMCSSICPMKNISIVNGKAVADNRCTMCYRCISSCPNMAITLLGKEVVEQCRFSNYE